MKRLQRVLVWLALVAVCVVPIPPGSASGEGYQGSHGLGLVPSEGNLPKFDGAYLAGSVKALPSVVDLSAGLPPIGNQASQNSCVGWAVGYYYKTFQEGQERGWDLTSPTHQFSPAFIYNQRPSANCQNDSGMSFYSAFRTTRDKGALPLSSFPYSQSDTCTQPSQAQLNQAWPYRADSFAAIFSGQGTPSLTELKTLLANGQPFAIAVPVYTSFYGVTYSNPMVPRHQQGETYYGGHAMFVVGYDDSVGGFLTANSWGSYWGRNGFAYLAYDFVQYDSWEAWVMTDHVEQQPTPTPSPTPDPTVNVNVPLYAGWNQIGFPIQPTASDVAAILAPIAADLEVAYAWDAINGEWRSYTPAAAARTSALVTLDPRSGLWLRVSQDVVLPLEGTRWSNPNVPLAEGWNLVSYPSQSTMDASTALASVAGSYETVLVHRRPDGGTAQWLRLNPSAPPAASTLLEFEPGNGLWIYADAASTWSLPS